MYKIINNSFYQMCDDEIPSDALTYYTIDFHNGKIWCPYHWFTFRADAYEMYNKFFTSDLKTRGIVEINCRLTMHVVDESTGLDSASYVVDRYHFEKDENYGKIQSNI